MKYKLLCIYYTFIEQTFSFFIKSIKRNDTLGAYIAQEMIDYCLNIQQNSLK
jgi:hypothetical protein